jgi:hypothetical protein
MCINADFACQPQAGNSEFGMKRNYKPILKSSSSVFHSAFRILHSAIGEKDAFF